MIVIKELRKHAAAASLLLKAMANERRLIILCHLTEGEKTVGELEDLVGLSQSALSQHLARLRRDGLVKTRRQAQNIFYSLNGESAVTVIGSLQGVFGPGRKAAAHA
jgi:DNA-binding transcriptional ArsR family regulator